MAECGGSPCRTGDSEGRRNGSRPQLRRQHRGDTWDVCAASLKRTEQSLRSLEEYGKLVDADFAGQCESLRYRLYTLEKAIDVGRTSRERLADVTLCVLLDGCDSAAGFEKRWSALVEAGVGMIQLRDKQLDDRDLIERGHTLRRLTRGTTTLAIVNDRADIAAAVQADGVHLGQEDLRRQRCPGNRRHTGAHRCFDAQYRAGAGGRSRRRRLPRRRTDVSVADQGV